MRGFKYNMTIVKPDKTTEEFHEVERSFIMEMVGKRMKEYYNIDYVLTGNHFTSLQMGFGGKFLKDIVKLEKLGSMRDNVPYRETKRLYAVKYNERKRQEKLAKSANADLLTA
jgi:hypothetical protein